MSDQITFRIRDRRKFQRELARLELEYDVIWDAPAHIVYTAICEIAIEDPDRLVEKIAEIQRGE